MSDGKDRERVEDVLQRWSDKLNATGTAMQRGGCAIVQMLIGLFLLALFLPLLVGGCGMLFGTGTP